MQNKLKNKKITLDLIVASIRNIDIKLAQALIREGKVIVNGDKVILPSLKFNLETIKIDFVGLDKQYVSRGAYKLLEAIQLFNIDLKNKVCLDIGSSTGGFVQVMLEAEANKVYAVDSGTNQLDYSLRINEKVKVYEQTNLKNLQLDMFDEKIDFVSCDVSFISLKHVFEVCSKILENHVKIMALIKPQFEASSKYVEEGGYVDPVHHEYIINKVVNFANVFGFKMKSIALSPIKGEKSKNIEYISLFEKIK
ncbi:TlyA family RNA methyltransferase [[Mycoplasma] falconis]|uniref:TlyA family RNA methyltransferase n=1 Tax=[Mycoplasma] falconis TaxID=92403 RepID=A0A501X9K5_9BACT|nr:TlyA family RNA methyltransferase [[Mycoplasma] falconis]TPE57074.1 TlyA family RNA methyltransferase [[Mycoplasma] falconis]